MESAAAAQGTRVLIVAGDVDSDAADQFLDVAERAATDRLLSEAAVGRGVVEMR